jgi:hypothetical protein
MVWSPRGRLRLGPSVDRLCDGDSLFMGLAGDGRPRAFYPEMAWLVSRARLSFYESPPTSPPAQPLLSYAYPLHGGSSPMDTKLGLPIRSPIRRSHRILSAHGNSLANLSASKIVLVR